MKIKKRNSKIILIAVSVVLLLAMLGGVLMQTLSLLEEDPAPFGGKTVIYQTFSKKSNPTKLSDTYHKDYFGVVDTKAGSYGIDNNRLRYAVGIGAVNTDPYINIDFGNYSISDISVATIDFDIEIAQIPNFPIYFNVEYRDFGTPKEAQLIYESGKFYLKGHEDKILGECPSNKFHLTFVSNSEKTLIYVDGTFLCETVCSYNPGANRLTGLRIGFLTNQTNKALLIYFDNVTVNTFAKDYKGNINKLFAKPDQLLKKNSDTIFGGTFEWPEE